MGLSAVTDVVLGVVTYVQELGPVVGPAVFVVVLTAWVILGLPCTLLNMVPGFLFGFKLGVLCNVTGKVAGSMISFFIAQAFSDRVKQWGQKYKAFRLIQKCVDKGGVVSICVVRLIYMPMSVKNYGLGALGAPAGLTFFASTACALPFAIIWTWAGAQCKDVAEMLAQTDKPTPKLNFQYVAIGAGVLALVYFGRKAAYQRLPDWVREELESDDSGPPGIDEKSGKKD